MEIKQDINFFEKPLWFQSDISKEEGFIWKDQDGYVYRSKYKAPTHLDILFLMFILLESQKSEYSDKLSLTRYKIVKGCSLSSQDSRNYERLKDSLKRWASVFISFEECFYEDGKRVSKGFHIIDSYKIEGKSIEIRLSTEWIQTIKESNFFKYINFDYYKSLKRPVSRRLFEILCKTFKGRDSWEIGLVKLGEKLTLKGRKKNVKGKIQEIFYPSVILATVKPAVNEINKKSESKKFFDLFNISPKEAFSISYSVNGNNIVFSKKLPNWVKQENKVENKAENVVNSAQKELVFEEDSGLTKLCQMMKSPTKGLKEEIGKYYREKGFDYVKWNIEYANKTATKSYTTYLKKCLKENWGEEFREVETTKIEAEKVHQEVKKKEIKASQAKDKEILELNKHYKNLPSTEQSRLWEEAKAFYLGLGLNERFMNKEMIMTKVRDILKPTSSNAS